MRFPRQINTDDVFGTHTGPKGATAVDSDEYQERNLLIWRAANNSAPSYGATYVSTIVAIALLNRFTTGASARVHGTPSRKFAVTVPAIGKRRHTPFSQVFSIASDSALSINQNCHMAEASRLVRALNATSAYRISFFLEARAICVHLRYIANRVRYSRKIRQLVLKYEGLLSFANLATGLLVDPWAPSFQHDLGKGVKHISSLDGKGLPPTAR
jgi:hypothetical protein